MCVFHFTRTCGNIVCFPWQISNDALFTAIRTGKGDTIEPGVFFFRDSAGNEKKMAVMAIFFFFLYAALYMYVLLLVNFNKDLRKLKSKRYRDVWNKSLVDRFKNRFPCERVGTICYTDVLLAAYGLFNSKC